MALGPGRPQLLLCHLLANLSLRQTLRLAPFGVSGKRRGPRRRGPATPCPFPPPTLPPSAPPCPPPPSVGGGGDPPKRARGPACSLPVRNPLRATSKAFIRSRPRSLGSLSKEQRRLLRLRAPRLPPGPLRPRVSDPHFGVWSPTPCGCGESPAPPRASRRFPERLGLSESPGARRRPHRARAAPAARPGLGNPRGQRGTRARVASSRLRAEVRPSPHPAGTRGGGAPWTANGLV